MNKDSDTMGKNIIGERRIIFFRLAVFICLATAAIICGYFSYTLLHNQEVQLQDDQFYSLSLQLENHEKQFMDAQVQVMKLMTNLFQFQCPDITDWPNCTVPIDTFSNMTTNLFPITNYRLISMNPLVTESQAASFELFAMNFYKSQGYPTVGTQANTGVDGIYVKGVNGNYHSNIVTPSDSKYKILVPIFIMGQLELNKNAALYNVYSEPVRAASINHVLNCSYTTGLNCGGITDIISLVIQSEYRPAALLNYPVRAFNQPDQIVGMMATAVNWDSSIFDSIPDYVNGLIIVLNSNCNGINQYTYSISNGKVFFEGRGDLHDTKYNSYAYSFDASPFTGAVKYTMTVYPSDAFSEAYITNLPMIASIVVVAVLMFTSIVFIMYDFLINRYVSEKDSIIVSRRQFVNFISHEIRTPLNTIASGMKLLLYEISTQIKKYHDKLDVIKTNENNTEIGIQNNTESSSIESITNTNTKEAIIYTEFTTQLQDYLQIVNDIEDSSAVSISILNDILNYDKLVKGKLKLEIEPFNVWDVARNSARAFIIQARQKNVTYEYQLEIDKDEKQLKFNEIEMINVNNTGSTSSLPINEFNHSTKTSITITPNYIENEFFSNSKIHDVENPHIPSQSILPIPKEEKNKIFSSLSSSSSSSNQNDKEIKNLVIVGDKMKISQVLCNMISNALKFTPTDGKVTVTVDWDKNDQRFLDLIIMKMSDDMEDDTGNIHDVKKSLNKDILSLRKGHPNTISRFATNKRRQSKYGETIHDFKNSGSINIKVTDSGAGLSQEQLSQLFQEGVQFNANKLQGGGGSGLGLWIAKGIVDMHYGLLTASSPGIGMGCTFMLVLPVFTHNVKNDSKKLSLRNDLPGNPLVNENIVIHERVVGIDHILLVDDSISNRKMTVRLLASKGYKVDEADDGLTAVDAYEKSLQKSLSNVVADDIKTIKGYDVILMDYEMPHMSGPHATEILRQKGYKGFIIGVTGNVMKKEQELFLSKGANKVLFKPLNINQMEETLISLKNEQNI